MAKKINNTDDMLSVELFVKNGKQYVFISNEMSTGAEYQVNTTADIGKCVAQYVEMYCMEESL